MVALGLFHPIKSLINARKNRVLTIAQAALPDSQYQAFKKLFLDEMGERGLERDLEVLLNKQNGVERDGRE